MSMNFGDELFVARRRGTQFARIQASGLGDVTFFPALDHNTNVVYYEARVRPDGSSTPVAYKHLGKPVPSGGIIIVNMRAILDSLTAGNYNVLISVGNADGAVDYNASNTFTVPLIPE